ncbi:MAG: hypothetical protein IH607_04440 [Firmicutes bacterium]|nr:hypothetical protein [Bacillota bacterium]
METGYLVGGIACAVYALFCFGIGVFKPQSIMKLVKQKLKLFTGSKEPGDRATRITCIVFGVLGVAGAVILFAVGAAND